MSEEVKKILECFKRHIEQNESMCCLSMNEVSILLDFITNLQNKYENQIHRYMNLKKYTTNLQEENEELRRFRYTIKKDETKTPPTITRTYKREYDELQKENKRLKESVNNLLKLCEEVIKENEGLYNHLCLEMRKNDGGDKE